MKGKHWAFFFLVIVDWLAGWCDCQVSLDLGFCTLSVRESTSPSTSPASVVLTLGFNDRIRRAYIPKFPSLPGQGGMSGGGSHLRPSGGH